jgi:hypothetical protein
MQNRQHIIDELRKARRSIGHAIQDCKSEKAFQSHKGTIEIEIKSAIKKLTMLL